jgi:hypothetical protein
VVWWGRDFSRKTNYSTHTNGVVENDQAVLTNVMAVAAHLGQGLALTSAGTVVDFEQGFDGGRDMPAGLSKVVSIAMEGSSNWAIRRDGSVARWGNQASDQDPANLVAGLSNITAVAWGGNRNYLALRRDGTVLGFRFDMPNPEQYAGLVRPVLVRGQLLSNVVALASMGYTPVMLKRDGAVFSLGYQTPGGPVEPHYELHGKDLYQHWGGESAWLPYQYTSAEPVVIAGRALTNVAALASGGGHCLALKRDGTVAAWGDNYGGESVVPPGLSNVTAIAAAERESVALRRDGTVIAWGDNRSGQTSVPAGLSNVVAIAATPDFDLAITTASIPATVYVPPHGRLEKMTASADLVFKGRAISNRAITNGVLPAWSKPCATCFEVISVLKGALPTNVISLMHITGRALAWSGPAPPPDFEFEIGQSYLVFAAKCDQPDWPYSPSPNGPFPPDEFRQLMLGSIAFRTLDAQPSDHLSVKQASWVEFNRLLNDTNPTNQLYAIESLDSLSKREIWDDAWWPGVSFQRQAVLTALLPLLTSRNEQVACRALACFEVESNAAVTAKPFRNNQMKSRSLETNTNVHIPLQNR